MSFIESFEPVPNKKESAVTKARLIYEETCENVELTNERALVLLSDPQSEYKELVLERIRNRVFEPSEEVRARIKELLH